MKGIARAGLLACATAAWAGEVSVQVEGVMPIGLGGHAVGRVGEDVVVAGGTYWSGDEKHWTGDVWLYCPPPAGAAPAGGAPGVAWRPGPPLPHPVDYAASACAGERLYVMGGSDGKRGLGETWVLSRAEGEPRWDRGPDLPEPLVYGAAVALGPKVLVFGGAPGPDLGKAPSAAVYLLDTAEREPCWQRVGTMPGRPRCLAGVAAHLGAVYVFGGYELTGHGYENSARALRFDPGSGSWRRLRDLPTARRGPAAVGLSSGVYILGGFEEDGGGSFSDRIWRYAPAAGTYTAAGRLPVGVVGMEAVALGDASFLAMGGEDRRRHRTDLVVMGVVSLP